MNSFASIKRPASGRKSAENEHSPRLNVKSLSERGVLAIVDQGLISGSNFIISIVLARSLAPQDYGVYALGFEVFLLLSVFYGCLVLEPMSVFGPSVYREHGQQYLGRLLRIHFVTSGGTLLVIAAAACMAHVLMPASCLAATLAGVSLAEPLVLLFWVTRRAFYVKLSPHGAVRGSGLYFAVLIAGLFLLYQWKLLSPFSAFLLMAMGAAIATVSMLRVLKPHLGAGGPYPHSREVIRQHWNYGRWALASAGPAWLSGAMYYPLLAHFDGMASAGKLKALLNLNSPVSQVFVAISLLSLPYVSHVYHLNGPRSANRLAWRLALLYGGGTFLYWAVLIAIRTPAVHVLYGGKYSEIVSLVPLLALGSVFRITATAQANILRGMQLPKLVCVVYTTAGVVGILAGVPLIWLYGFKGAVLAFIVTGATASFAATAAVVRRSAKLRAAATVAEGNVIAEEETPVALNE